MGTTRDIVATENVLAKAFCDEVYTELQSMRMKLMAITDELAITYGEDNRQFATYKRHLVELADQIEWKLQILSHACPFDWKGSTGNIESTVSVREPDVQPADYSGGYLGG